MSGSKDKALADLQAVLAEARTLNIADTIVGMGARVVLSTLAPKTLKTLDKIGLAPGASLKRRDNGNL